MHLFTQPLRYLTALLLTLAISGGAFAATRTATATGNWNSTATWGGNPVPVAGDVAIISSAITVTVTAAAAADQVQISAGTLTINTGQTLTLTALGLSQTGGTVAGAGSLTVGGAGINFSAGTYTVAGTTTVNAGGFNITAGTAAPAGVVTVNAGGVNISGGQLTHAANLTIAAGGLVLSNNAIYLQASNNTTAITGGVTVSGTALYNQTATGSTVTFTGGFNSTSTTAQILKSSVTVINGNFVHGAIAQTAANMPPTLTLRPLTGAVALTGPASGSLGITNLTVDAATTQNISVNGNVAVATTFQISTGAVSTLTLAASSTLNTGSSWNWNAGNITLTPGGTSTLISGAVNSGGGAGTVTLNDNQWFISGTYPNVSGSLNPGSGRVVYNGTATQTVRAFDYYNLRFTGAGSKIFGARANAIDTIQTIANDWTINNGSGSFNGYGTNINRMSIGRDFIDSASVLSSTAGTMRTLAIGRDLRIGSSISYSPSFSLGSVVKYISIGRDYINTSTTAFAPSNTGGSLVMIVNRDFYGNALTLNTATLNQLIITGNAQVGGIINLKGSTNPAFLNLNVGGTFSTYSSILAPAFPAPVSATFIGALGGITTSASPNVVRVNIGGDIVHNSSGAFFTSGNVAEATFGGNFTGAGNLNFSKARVTFSGANVTLRPATYMRLKFTGAGTKSLLPAGGTLFPIGLQLTANQVIDLSNNQAFTLAAILPAALGGGSGTLTLKGATTPGTTTTNQVLKFADTTGAYNVNNSTTVQGPVGTVFFDPSANCFYQLQFLKGSYNNGAAAQVTAGYSLLRPEVILGNSVSSGTGGPTGPTVAFGASTQYFKVRIADNAIFTLARNDGTPASLNTDAGSIGYNRDHYFVLGNGSKFSYLPGTSGATASGNTYKFSVGYNYKVAGYLGVDNLAAGSISTTTGSATVTINQPPSGTADPLANFNLGDELILDDGTIVGVVSALTTTTLTLQAPATATFSNRRARISNTYRPVYFIPTATGVAGTISINFFKNLSAGVSNLSVPDVGNRRANYIVNLTFPAGSPTANIQFETNVTSDQGDFNTNLLPGNVSLYQYANSVWNKYAGSGAALTAATTYPGTPSASGNYTITANALPVAGSNNYIYGQYVAGGDLQNDPQYTWTNAGGNGLWTNGANWTRSPGLPAGSFPNAANHNVVISGIGAGPIIGAADTVSAFSINQNGRNLSLSGTLRLYGNWNLNQPAITDQGDGAISVTGNAITGTGTNFGTLGQPGIGAILYGDDRTVYGIITAVANGQSATLSTVAGLSLPALANQSYLFRQQTFSAGSGTITRTAGQNLVQGSGFTDALRGRMILSGGVFVGIVLVVEGSTQLRLVDAAVGGALAAATWTVSDPVASVGTGAFTANTGSRVRVISNTNNQAIPAGTYYDLHLDDTRSMNTGVLTTYLLKGPNQQGGDLTINGQLRVKGATTILTLFGARLIMNDGSTLYNYFPADLVNNPSNNKPSKLRSFTSFDQYGGTNPFSVVFNKTTRGVNLYVAHYSTTYGENSPIDGPLGGINYTKLNNLTILGGNGNSTFNVPNGSTLTLNGGLYLFTAAGGGNANRLQLGNAVGSMFLTIGGDFNQIGNAGNNGIQASNSINLTLNGNGAMTSNLYAAVSGLPFASLTQNRTNFTGTFTGQPVAVALSKGDLTLSNAALALTGDLAQTGGRLFFTGAAQSLAGNMTITGGNIIPGTGTFTLSGANAQVISGAPQLIGMVGNTDTTRLNNLAVNKTAGSVTSNAGRIYIYNTLSLNTANTATVTAGTGEIVLRSLGVNAGRTARIDVLPASQFGKLAGGNWVIERNTPAKQGWYFYAPAVTGQTLAGINGFDIRVTPANNANVYFHTENDTISSRINGIRINTNGWKAATALSNPLNPGAGLRFYAGGAYAAGRRVISLAGTPVQGNSVTKALTVSFPGWTSSGYNFIGNPYASEISFTALRLLSGQANIVNAVVTWDGRNNRYQYFAPGGGNPLGSTAVAGGSNVIASGQSFFVKANAAGNLIFNESIKTSSITDGAFFRQGEDETVANKLRITMVDAAQNEDEAIVGFAQGLSNGYDQATDLAKFTNTFVNVSTEPEAGLNLAINGMAIPVRETIVPLNIRSSASNQLTLSFSGVGSFAGMQLYLLDRVANTTTPIADGSSFSIALTPALRASSTSGYAIVFRPAGVTGVSNTLSAARLSVFPNPSVNHVATVQVLNAEITNAVLRVTDLSGRLVTVQTMTGNKTTLSGLAAGTYHLEVRSDKNVLRERLIVE